MNLKPTEKCKYHTWLKTSIPLVFDLFDISENKQERIYNRPKYTCKNCIHIYVYKLSNRCEVAYEPK